MNEFHLGLLHKTFKFVPYRPRPKLSTGRDLSLNRKAYFKVECRQSLIKMDDLLSIKASLS